MESKAVLRYVRMSAQKARLVADLVRGRKVGDALNILRFTKKKMARVIEKVIASAKANAENNHNVADGNDMKVARIFVDAGPQMRRQLSRARGRVDQLRKPMSHVTVVLEDTVEGRRKAAPGKAAATKVAAPAKAAAVAKKPKKETAVKKTAAKKTAVKKTKKDKES
ncbi:MAG: 50S ribosomal protein L22 [Nitrospinae bacterium]|nr:50S ribosomal protein L22 [Nitrospinota bacterium]